MEAPEIIEKAKALPKEDQALIIDSLIESIHSPSPEVESKWLEIAEKRIQDLESGKTKTIPAEDVFKRLDAKYKDG